MSDELKRRQACVAMVEDRLLTMLIQFEPCHKLTVGDVRMIASYARRVAFDAFDPNEPPNA